MFPNTMLAETAGGAGNTLMTIGMIVAFIAVFYFFGIRPQKKQEKEEEIRSRNDLTWLIL